MILIQATLRGAFAFVGILCVGMLGLQIQDAGGAEAMIGDLASLMPDMDSLPDVEALKARLHNTVNDLLG